MSFRPWMLSLCVLFGSSLVSFAAERVSGDPLDWPYWRGPEMNGVSREKNLPSSWDPDDGENLLWKNEELGTRSTPIVMRGKLYTLCRHKPATLQEAEKVVCADAETGEILWEHVFNVYLSDVPDTRVGWSSVVGDTETGNVVALGVCGYFVCLNPEGEVVWSRSLSEEFGLLTTYGGRTNFPVVFENLALISGVIIGWGDQARPEHRILAFDKRNGQLVWSQGTKPLPEDTTYSTPVVTVVNGQAQFILGTGDGGVYSYQPRTGKRIWKYDVSLRGINTGPVIAGNMVICGHSEENIDDTKMGALFAVDASKSGDLTKTGEIWRIKEEFIGKTQPVVVDDRVYAIDDSGNFFVNDLKTGKLIGKQKLGTMGRGSPLYADGKFYCTDANGRWYIFEPEENKGLKKIHQLRMDAEINGSPIVSHGKIYLPTDVAMYCIGLKNAKPEADPIPPLEPETPVSEDEKPAQALVIPADSLLRPGQKQQFQVLLYNSNGQYLGKAKSGDVTFAVEGLGTIDADGKYQSVKEGDQNAVVITAKVGEVAGTARLRVIPDFPWTYNFDNGRVPVTGVGMRYRHIVVDFDFYRKLKEADRLAARMYIYLHTQFTNLPPSIAKFDDTTAAQSWTNLKRYLEIVESVVTQDQAKAALDGPLAKLQEAGLITDWKWTGDEESGPRLEVSKNPNYKITGNGVMCKITTIPKGTRSQGWMGHPDSQNYEIQADVFADAQPVASGADPNSRTPDIGLTCMRYRFDMMGASQQLKLYSWIPHDQKYYSQPFDWVADTWYRMKFRVTTEERDGETVALLQGKAWKRDGEEPAEWSIQWTDSPANVNGSPGLFGNAKDAEIFFDNVTVTPLGPAQ